MITRLINESSQNIFSVLNINIHNDVYEWLKNAVYSEQIKQIRGIHEYKIFGFNVYVLSDFFKLKRKLKINYIFSIILIEFMSLIIDLR